MNSKVRDTYVFFDSIFHLISEILLSWIKRLAPFMTAILPGFFFSYTIYEFVYELTGLATLSMFIGISGFVVLESAGIWSGHKIAEYAGGSKFDWLMLIPVSTLILYTTIGIGTLWFLDSLSQDVKIIGTSMFLLACVIYILFGLQSYQDREERKVEKAQKELKNEEKEIKKDEIAYRRQQLAEKKQFERELKVKELELSHEENMAKIVPAILQATEVKKVKYDEKKMAKLKAFLKVKPNALEQFTKVELAEKLKLTRPTLDKYLEIYNEELGN